MYPGTFDPITLGHEDLVRRAARLFDKVIVAIAANTGSKVPMFSVDERVDMARTALAGIGNVEVTRYNGLTVEFARKRGLRVIIRGLRAVSDFEYEFQLASMNRQLAPEIETLFMAPDDRYAYVSSSLVREIAALGGDVTPFVHAKVLAALKQALR
jgi:pantetheine-phosphate adenylyltransferase